MGSDIEAFTKADLGPAKPGRKPKPKQLTGGRPSKVSLQRAQRDLNDRQLQYVAWLSIPEKFRNPPSRAQFAEQLGVTYVTLWRWEKDPRVIEAVRWMVMHNAGDPARIGDVVNFMYELTMDQSAEMKLRVQAARDFMKAVGVEYVYKSDPKLLRVRDVEEIDLDGLSDEEVWDLYNERAGGNGAPVDPAQLTPYDERTAGLVVGEVVDGDD